jgi:putative flippase GtrA
MTARGGGRLLPFAGIGAIGFVIDAALLTLLVNGFGWNHYSARAVSFGCAVTATWLGNRHFVFEKTAHAPKEYARYLTSQVIAACLNLATYVLLIEAFPPLAHWPVLPLAGGAIVGLAFNFNVAKYLIYAPAADAALPAKASGEDGYTGRDNLEAMTEAENYNAFLVSLVQAHCGSGRVLDFGAGSGTFARPLRDAGRDIVCVEPDERLRAMLAEDGLAAVAGTDEVAPASIDCAYTLNVLEHIEDDAAALETLRERLRPGGTLFVYVPAFNVLFGAMDEKVGHFRRYRRRELERMLEQAGFEVLESRYVDSLGFAASLVYRFVGDRSGAISPASVALYDRLVFPLSRLLDRVLGPFLGKNVLCVARAARG